MKFLAWLWSTSSRFLGQPQSEFRSRFFLRLCIIREMSVVYCYSVHLVSALKCRLLCYCEQFNAVLVAVWTLWVLSSFSFIHSFIFFQGRSTSESLYVLFLFFCQPDSNLRDGPAAKVHQWLDTVVNSLNIKHLAQLSPNLTRGSKSAKFVVDFRPK